MILSKADPNSSEIKFSIDDLKGILKKKQQAKIELKSEEERRIKEKIEKKIREKAAEADALNAVKKQEESSKQ